MDNLQPIEKVCLPKTINLPFYILIGLIISATIFESILETVGLEYKKILTLPESLLDLV